MSAGGLRGCGKVLPTGLSAGMRYRQVPPPTELVWVGDTPTEAFVERWDVGGDRPTARTAPTFLGMVWTRKQKNKVIPMPWSL